VLAEKPDLVIMDQMMPEMDGLEALRVLRANPATCSLPVLVASAIQDPGEVAELVRAGADGYVSKPFQAAQLLEIVRRHLPG